MAEPLTNYFVGRARREMRAGPDARSAAWSARSIATWTATSCAARCARPRTRAAWTSSTSGASARGRSAATSPAATCTGDEAVIAGDAAPAVPLLPAPRRRRTSSTTPTRTLAHRRGRRPRSRQAHRPPLELRRRRVNTISPEYEVNDLGFQRRVRPHRRAGRLRLQRVAPRHGPPPQLAVGLTGADGAQLQRRQHLEPHLRRVRPADELLGSVREHERETCRTPWTTG